MPPTPTPAEPRDPGSGQVANLPNRPDPVGELRFKVDLPRRRPRPLPRVHRPRRRDRGQGLQRGRRQRPRAQAADAGEVPEPRAQARRHLRGRAAQVALGDRSGEAQRIAVTVSLDRARRPARPRWSFADAFPVKWTGPNFNAELEPGRDRDARDRPRRLQMQAGADAMPMPEGYVKAKLAIEGGTRSRPCSTRRSSRSRRPTTGRSTRSRALAAAGQVRRRQAARDAGQPAARPDAPRRRQVGQGRSPTSSSR